MGIFYVNVCFMISAVDVPINFYALPNDSYVHDVLMILPDGVYPPYFSTPRPQGAPKPSKVSTIYLSSEACFSA